MKRIFSCLLAMLLMSTMASVASAQIFTDTNGNIVKPGDVTNEALRVNVVSGSTGNAAAGNTGVAVPTQAGFTGVNVGGTLRGVTATNVSGSTYALDVNVAGGSTGNGAASNTGSAVPVQADFQGVKVGANLIGMTGVTVGAVTAGDLNIATVGGSAAVTCGVVGCLGVGIRDAAGNARGANVTAANELMVNVNNTVTVGTHAVTQSGTWNIGTLTSITNALPAGTNVIGHVLLDSGSTTAVTNAGTFAVQAAQSGTWNVTNISGTITLPTGASTSAKQPSLGTAGTASADVITVQGIASMTPLTVSGTVTANAGTGNFTVTQPTFSSLNATVKGDAAAGSPSAGVLSVQGVTGMTALKTDGSGVTQPVSGTVAITSTSSQTITAVQPTGTNLHIVCDSGCSSSTAPADNSTFTAGSTSTSPVAGFYHATRDTVTDGRQANIAINANRALLVQIEDTSKNPMTSAQIGATTLSTSTTGLVVDSVMYYGDGTRVLSTDVVPVSQSGNWTARVVGNAGAALDAAGQNAASPANELLTGCQFNTSPTTITSTNMSPVQCDNVGNTLVKVNTALPAGTNVIGHVITDTGSTTGVTQLTASNLNATVVGTGTFTTQSTLQTQTDTVMVGGVNVKEINAVTPLMGNGTTGTGSLRVTIASDNTAFAVNSTLSAETTKVIGTARILGNGGGAMDAAGQNAASPANELLTGCQFNTSPTTITSANMSPVQCDNAGNTLVKVNTALPAGTNVIGHVILDTTSTTGVTQLTAANLNATVVGTGTFAVQATLAAETTKVIGTARVIGNGGATLDSTVGAGTAPTNQMVVGAIYNSTEISPTTGQAFALQADSKGRVRNVLMDAAGNTRGANVDANNNLGVAAVGTLSSNGAAAATNRVATLPAIAESNFPSAQTAGRDVALRTDLSGNLFVGVVPTGLTTYVAIGSGTVATTATDITILPGNATNTVVVTQVTVSCTQTTAGINDIYLIKRSTANSGGTSANMTVVPLDSNNAAGVSVPLQYSANPTTGTLVGAVDRQKIGFMAPATASPNDIYIWKPSMGQSITLRGTAQGLAVNLGSQTTTGAACNVAYNYIETTGL